MLKSLIAFGALAALANCQQNPPATEPAAPPTVAAPPAAPTAQCYGYIAQDTAYLVLNGAGPAITGTLIYHYAGKDRNRGTIRGAFSGDTLRANYTFRSEGITSVREVVFMKRGAGLVEGYGPVAEQGGKTAFKQPHHLKFDNKITLAPVECKDR